MILKVATWDIIILRLSVRLLFEVCHFDQVVTWQSQGGVNNTVQ